MGKFRLIAFVIILSLVASCTNNTNMLTTEIVSDTTKIKVDTTLIMDTIKVVNETPLNKELKGIYKGALLYSHWPKDTVPKMFFDSLMILRKGSAGEFKIDSISLDFLNKYEGISNSAEKDTLEYLQKISVYQARSIYVIRSTKTIWTTSMQHHNVASGKLYDSGYYKKD
jgi:hypothetical protein